MKKYRNHLYCLILSFLIGIIAISGIMLIQITSKDITLQTNYWSLYSPFSDIYIKEMVPSGNGSIVYFYPEGNATFSFVIDGTIRKEVGSHFIECTRSGRYGNNGDFGMMKELFKTPREGACYTQVDFMVRLAHEQGIITRRINLWQSPTNGILTAGDHTTMEIYDRETKQWIWMDPLYNIIEGKIGNKTITLYDLQIAINRGENITLVMTDGKEIQFDQWQYARIWENYLNPSQKITYVTPEVYNRS